MKATVTDGATGKVKHFPVAFKFELEELFRYSKGILSLCLANDTRHCQMVLTAIQRSLSSLQVYATARALFVCPRKRKLVEEAIKYAYNQIFMQ